MEPRLYFIVSAACSSRVSSCIQTRNQNYTGPTYSTHVTRCKQVSYTLNW